MIDMNMSHPLFELEQRLGYRFKNMTYMEHALTHSSKNGSINNERIEFVGDRVLNLVMAHTLFEQFPTENEGALAKKHSALVQGKMLAAVGHTINIGDFLIMSDAERQSGETETANIVSDAMDALLVFAVNSGGTSTCARRTGHPHHGSPAQRATKLVCCRRLINVHLRGGVFGAGMASSSSGGGGGSTRFLPKNITALNLTNVIDFHESHPLGTRFSRQGHGVASRQQLEKKCCIPRPR